ETAASLAQEYVHVVDVVVGGHDVRPSVAVQVSEQDVERAGLDRDGRSRRGREATAPVAEGDHDRGAEEVRGHDVDPAVAVHVCEGVGIEATAEPERGAG